MSDKDLKRVSWFYFFVACGVGLLSALVVGLVFRVHWVELPEPMAAHWGMVSGAPDGAVGRQEVMTLLLLLCCVTSGACALSGVREAATADRSRLLAVTVFMGALSVGLAVVMTSLNRGAATWQQAGHNSFPLSTSVVLVPAVLALLTHWVARRAWSNSSAIEAGLEANAFNTALALSSQERVFWSRTAFNPWLLGMGALWALLLLGVSSPFLPTPPEGPNSWVRALLTAVAAFLFNTMSCVTVQVNNRGVLLRYGNFFRIHQRFALDRIESAAAVTVRPMAHGGWGYRGVPRLSRKTTVVVRGGPGLELRLHGGRVFRVTVDEPQTGVDLINGLLQRGQRKANIEVES